MADTAQIEVLERSKRRAVLVLCLTAVALLVVSALRFVARLNDALSGKPDYVRILTETFGRQLASQTQMQFPVIVEQDEHGTCQAVSAPSIAEEEIRGTIYLLTYSEQQTLTCITTYVVPTDASRVSTTLRDFGPAEGRNYGPALLGTVKGIAEYRIARVYAPEYLRRLHWRYTPHFPLSPSEAASLRSQSSYSGGTQPADSVSIAFDYGELRAEIAERHQLVNSVLSVLLIGCIAVSILLIRKLALAFRALSQYCRVYQLQLTPRVFLKGNVATELSIARRRYFERQQQDQSRLREEEKLRALGTGWEEGLRSALPNLIDEHLRTRVQECLEHKPQDLEQMKSLWVEVQEQTGLKTPADKLNLLLESTKSYCTEEEFLAGRSEAFAILNQSGFRAARTFAIAMHDHFKIRAREMEELENSDRNIV